MSSLSTAPPSRLERSRRSSRPPPSESAQALWQRFLWVGVLAAALLSVPAVVMAEARESWQSLLLSVIFSTTLAGLLFSGAGSVTLAICLHIRALRCWAPRAAARVTAGLLAIYTVLRGAAEGYHLITGGPLHWDSVRAWVGAEGSVLTQVAVLPVISLALLLFILGGALGVFGYRALMKAMGRLPLSRSAGWRGAASLVVLAALLRALTTPGFCQDGGLNRTADLALLASLRGGHVEPARGETASLR